MDEQNRILNSLLGGAIVVPFPPRGVTEPEILDCGFGNHAWIDGLLADHDDWQVSTAKSGLWSEFSSCSRQVDDIQ